MADPISEKGKETATPDPEAQPNTRSSSDSPTDATHYEEIRIAKDGVVGAEGEEVVDGDVNKRPDLSRFRSDATGTSGTSTTTAALPPQKPWYKQPNPLRWGKIPPVPKERGASSEHKAGFFSLLIFEWMSPLMRVSDVPSMTAQGPKKNKALLIQTTDWI